MRHEPGADCRPRLQGWPDPDPGDRCGCRWLRGGPLLGIEWATPGLRGEALDRPGKLLPPTHGGPLRARDDADGTRQPDGAVRVDPEGAGEFRRAEAGPRVGTGARCCTLLTKLAAQC